MTRGILSILADIDGVPTILSCEELNGMMGPEDEGCRYGGKLIFEIEDIAGFKALSRKVLLDFGYIERDVKISEIDFKQWTLDSLLDDGILNVGKVHSICWDVTDYVYFKNLSSVPLTMRCSTNGEAGSLGLPDKSKTMGFRIENADAKSIILSLLPGGSAIMRGEELLDNDRTMEFMEKYRMKFAKPEMALPESAVNELRGILSSIKDVTEIAKKDGNHEVIWFLDDCSAKIESLLREVRPMRLVKTKKKESSSNG